MTSRSIGLIALLLVAPLAAPALGGDKNASAGLTVDKSARTVTIDCKVAPRKLPNLKQVYPIEVVATFPAPKGQKAHETVLTFDVKPSDVHKALESLGLKPGKPALGDRGPAAGPEVDLTLVLPKRGGGTVEKRIEEVIVDTRGGKLPKLRWLFTGSAMKNPDPEKDDVVYGADLSGTLITLFPVTDDTVFQTDLGKKDEGRWRLEVNKELLPEEGTAVKLVIRAR